MRFMDELIGSEGERCLVASSNPLGSAPHPGVIENVLDKGEQVEVRLTKGGTLIRVGYERITLVDEETV